MRTWVLAAAAGGVLGVVSRVEEVTGGFSLGLSSNGTWLALAFALGVLAARGGSTGASPAPAARGDRPGRAPRAWDAALRSPRASRTRRAAALGAVALTAANVAYYLWIAATEPGQDLAAVAGSPVVWLALGVGGGVVFGGAGHVAAQGSAPARLLGAVLLAGVLIVDGSSALRGGPLTDAIGLLAGLALPALVPVRRELRASGVGAAAFITAVAATGALDAFSP